MSSGWCGDGKQRDGPWMWKGIRRRMASAVLSGGNPRGRAGWLRGQGAIVGAVLLMMAAGTVRLWLGQKVGWPEGSLKRAAGQILWPFGRQGNVQGVMEVRLVRVVIGGVVGLALAGGGVALQNLLRNPLAEPFILGLSSGAALGVMVQWKLGYLWGGAPALGPHAGALAGACAAAAVVYAASRRHGVLDPLGLLLTGVVLSTLCGAAIMLLNYLHSPAGLRSGVDRWMMGYLNEAIPLTHLWAVAVATLAVLGALWWLGPAMDVASFSDAEAESLGVNMRRLRSVLFVCASVLAAGAVVLAGPIGFVGLICPHVARLLVGPGHRKLVVTAACLGGALVLVADSLAAVLDRAMGIGLMPIGIFTALTGGPVFLWMLRPQLGRGTI